MDAAKLCFVYPTEHLENSPKKKLICAPPSKANHLALAAPEPQPTQKKSRRGRNNSPEKAKKTDDK